MPISSILKWTRWGRNKMAATIWQKACADAFSWRKILVFRFKFHWTLFLRVESTCQHWFRYWLVTSHYLNQWWHGLMTHLCVTRPQWVNLFLYCVSPATNVIQVPGIRHELKLLSYFRHILQSLFLCFMVMKWDNIYIYQAVPTISFDSL